MTTIDELMALADEYMRWGGKDRDRQALRAAIEAALKPGEPVAWFHSDHESIELSRVQRVGWKPLYKAPQPQQWVGLTYEETNLIVRHHSFAESIVRATEAKLREKNGGGEYSQDTHQPGADSHQPQPT